MRDFLIVMLLYTSAFTVVLIFKVVGLEKRVNGLETRATDERR